MKCSIHTSVAKQFNEAMLEVVRSYTSKSPTKNYDFVMIALSYRYPIEEINETIRNLLGSDRFVAFHSTDSFCNGAIVHDGVTALFISFEREGSVECYVGRHVSTDTNAVLHETAAYLDARRNSAHLLVAGLCNNEMAFFVDKLSAYDIADLVLLGGISSGFPIGKESNTYQFFNGEIIRDGFVVVTFHHVQAASSVAMGFEPVGIQYTITKAKGYRVYEVDRAESFSTTVTKLMDGIENFKPEYLWYTPAVILENGKSQEMLTLRTFRNMSDEWVEFYGPVKEGQRIKLSYGDVDQLLEADKKSIRRLKRDLPSPDVLFNFSCTARQYVLEEWQEAENITYLEEINVPLFGFFTFGEIGHDPQKKSLQFYNETSLLIGMREL